ncbi:MAG: hypothetical protein HOV94_19710 [Saccharothrix sp.]|nr:hypothetical protein [Saccharothrix sp.]
MYESQALFNRREIADGVDEMLDVLATWPAGTVVERRGDILVARMTPDEADAWEEAHGAETRARNESARAAAQRAADSNVNRFLRRPAPSEWGRQ